MKNMAIFPLSHRQEALWVEDEIHPGLPINNVFTRLTIKGPVEADAFIQAFNRLCCQYSIFYSAIELDKTSGRRVFKLFEKPKPLELITVFEGSSVLDYEQSSNFQRWCEYRFTYGEYLYKAQIVKFSNELFVFYVNQHHSITDGFSCKKIHQLLSDYYQVETGAKDDNNSLTLHQDNFFDFLTEKQVQRQSASFESNDEFWRSRYSKPVEPIQFYNQSVFNKTAQTTRITYQLDNETVALLNDVFESISTSVIFTSVLFSFLNRITLNKDLSVGVQSLNRTDTYSNTLGLLMEVCPNRVFVEKDDTFEKIVEKVHSEVEAVREYRDHFVSAKRTGYEVILNIQAASPNSFAGIEADYELTTPLNLVDKLEPDIPETIWSGRESLLIQVSPSLDKCHYELSFDFNLGVWPDSIFRHRAIEHFCILLKQCLLKPDQKVADFNILTANEKSLLLPAESSAKQRGEKLPTIMELFRKQVALRGDKPAIQFNDINVSYRELDEQVTNLAIQLLSMGVKANILVGVCVDRSPQMSIALLAVMRAGGVYVPIDPKQPKDRIALILEDAAPFLILTEKELSNSLGLAGGGRQVICLDDKLPEFSESSFEQPFPDSDDLAYVIFTSGSTGRPKGVEIKHHGLTSLLLAMAESPGMSHRDKILAITTISFDMAVPEMFLSFILGGTIRIVPYNLTIDGEQLKRLIDAEDITVFQATPATYRLLISSGWKGKKTLKLLCGGEALPFKLSQDLLKRCGSLWNMYGPTETTVWSSSHQVKKGEPFISIGKAIKGTQLFVLDEQLNSVPIGVPGELYIAGDGVARGYYANQAMTDEKFIANPFSSVPNAKMYKTGDLVRFLPDLCLEYLGRIDFQVKIRGFRIELGEIETVLANFGAVGQCVVTTWPNESGELSLIAYLVASGESTLDGGQLREYLKTKLPSYMIPSKFILLENFPLTPNGKVDRKSLPAPDLSLIVTENTEYVEPRNDFEHSLVSAWQTILKLSQVGITDNFFDLGGDSLMTVPLVHEMERATGIKFDIGDIFSFPTIRQLVEAQGDNVERKASSIVSLQPKGEGIPLFCLCGINRYQDLANSLGKTQPVFGIYAADEQLFLEDLLAGKESGISVEQLTRAYYDAICRQQPEGPYQLAGISFGGLLAFETARLLKANDKEVLSVVLLDAILPSSIKRSQLNKSKRFVKGTFNAIRTSFYRLLGVSINQSSEKITEVRDRAFYKSMQEYQFSDDVYDGVVVLMKANDKRFWGKGVSFLPDYGWSRFVKGKIDCYEIDGDHLGIIEEPNVSKVANHMLRYLKR